MVKIKGSPFKLELPEGFNKQIKSGYFNLVSSLKINGETRYITIFIDKNNTDRGHLIPHYVFIFPAVDELNDGGKLTGYAKNIVKDTLPKSGERLKEGSITRVLILNDSEVKTKALRIIKKLRLFFLDDDNKERGFQEVHGFKKAKELTDRERTSNTKQVENELKRQQAEAIIINPPIEFAYLFKPLTAAPAATAEAYPAEMINAINEGIAKEFTKRKVWHYETPVKKNFFNEVKRVLKIIKDNIDYEKISPLRFFQLLLLLLSFEKYRKIDSETDKLLDKCLVSANYRLRTLSLKQDAELKKLIQRVALSLRVLYEKKDLKSLVESISTKDQKYYLVMRISELLLYDKSVIDDLIKGIEGSTDDLIKIVELLVKTNELRVGKGRFRRMLLRRESDPKSLVNEFMKLDWEKFVQKLKLIIKPYEHYLKDHELIEAAKRISKDDQYFYKLRSDIINMLSASEARTFMRLYDELRIIIKMFDETILFLALNKAGFELKKTKKLGESFNKLLLLLNK